MNLADYSDAWLPEGRTVFGVPLLPLCIGHALLLHRLRSPLVPSLSAGGEGWGEVALPGLGDLLLALEICRRPALHLPSRARLKWLGLGQLRFTQRQKLRLEGRYLDGLRDFRGYWHDAFARMPATWDDDKDKPRASGVPQLVGLKVRCMSWLGASEAQALATPISRALWDVCAHSALEGNLKLHTAEEEEALAASRAAGGTVITMEEEPGDGSQVGGDRAAAIALAAARLSALNSQPSTAGGLGG